MIELKNNEKIIKDVIHGDIVIDELAQQIIETKEFKRLMGITQTGTSKYIFEGLKDENRYYHSIGAYYIMDRIIKHFEDCLRPYGISINLYQKEMAKIAMLLHDIGHGPMSHTIEKITKYPHEKMTVDIIRNEQSEVHKVLSTFFSDSEIESLISFIDYESNGEVENDYVKRDNIIDILKLLVSNQIDADRLDYLLRDAYYANYKSLIDLDKIINGFNITIDKDRWLFICDQNCLSQYETVLFERSRNYRDIYLHPLSILADTIVVDAVNAIENNDVTLKSLTKEIRDMIEKKGNMPLESILKLDDKALEDTLLKINNQNDNMLLSYQCNIKQNLKDYIEVSPDKNIESICRHFRMTFSDLPNIDSFDFLNSGVIVNEIVPLKIYKSNNREGIFINKYGNIVDIYECSNIINKNPSEIKVCFINFNLLRLYFGIDEYSFNQKYASKINKFIEWVNYPEKEFELKYVRNQEQNLDCNKVIKLLEANGFSIKKEANILNTDNYFDTRNLDLFKNKKSMRIRQIELPNNDKTEYEVTFKSPTGEKAKFSTRNEKSDVMTSVNIEEAKKILENKNIDVKDILSFPILKVVNNRHTIELVKNGILIELAFDNVINHNLINGLTSSEQMIEIEPKLGSAISDRIILNEIFNLFNINLPEIVIDSNPNKYYTGLTSTNLVLDKIDTDSIMIKK